MNARVSLFACLALIVGSVVLVPASAHIGVGSEAAATLSSLSLAGGIATAFMTVKKEADSDGKDTGRAYRRR